MRHPDRCGRLSWEWLPRVIPESRALSLESSLLTGKIAHEVSLLAGNVAVLPAIISVEEAGPSLLALSLALRFDRAETIVVTHVEDVDGIGLRQGAIPADD